MMGIDAWRHARQSNAAADRRLDVGDDVSRAAVAPWSGDRSSVSPEDQIADIGRRIERLESERDQARQQSATLESERQSPSVQTMVVGHRHLGEMVAWGAAALVSAVLVALLQVNGRGPLVWDEVGRVSESTGLVFALRAGDLGQAWDWIHAQVYWPFLPPLLNGLVLTFTDPITAAWLPSVVAFALAGVLAGRLTIAMGGGQRGGWLAAVMTWLTPMNARLSAGAFTELIGACQLLLVLWLLVRVGRDGTTRVATLAGVAAAVGWFIKYDYGILAAAIVGGTGLYTIVVRRSLRAVIPYVIAGGAMVLTLGAWLLFNTEAKLRALWAFINSEAPGASTGTDWGFYFERLLTDDEIGLALPVAVLFLVGVVWAVVTSARRVETRGVAVCFILGYIMYSLATGSKPPYVRYLGPLLPILASVAAAATMDLVFRLRARVIANSDSENTIVARRWFQLSTWTRRFTSAQRARGFSAFVMIPLFVLLGWQLLHQARSSTGVGMPFWFLAPYGAVNESLDFAASTTGDGDQPLLMIGQANELNYYSLQLTWTLELGRPAPAVVPIPEAPPEQRRGTLMNAIAESGASRIVGFAVTPGSQLDNSNFRDYFASQTAYLRIAQELEADGVLLRIGTFYADDGRLTTTVWEIAEQPST